MSNPDYTALAENLESDYDAIMEEAERRCRAYNHGVRGQIVRPQNSTEYWVALVAMERSSAAMRDLQERLARAEEWSRKQAEDIMTLGQQVGAAERQRDEARQSMQYAWEELAYTRQQRDAAVEHVRRWVSWCDGPAKPHPYDQLQEARAFLSTLEPKP